MIKVWVDCLFKGNSSEEPRQCGIQLSSPISVYTVESLIILQYTSMCVGQIFEGLDSQNPDRDKNCEIDYDFLFSGHSLDSGGPGLKISL